MNFREIIEQYIAGWKENDEAKILAVLDPDCIIIESHGPTYRGLEKVKTWIQEWIAQGNKIITWDITSFNNIFPSNAAIEWMFECTAQGEKHHFDGMSMITFKDKKISYIREYRTTKPLFDF